MQGLVHHVFFWLKNPNSEEDRFLFLENIQQLGEIEAVKAFHVGVPADTEKRPVIDNSYTFSLVTVFDSIEAEAEYQTHPKHLSFIENCKVLWDRVQVYDSMGL